MCNAALQSENDLLPSSHKKCYFSFFINSVCLIIKIYINRKINIL
jgi:hypothetical protein